MAGPRGEPAPSRRRLVDRIVGLRRSHAARSELDADAGRPQTALSLDDLAERVERLEAVVEQLQDSIHREAVRQKGEIGELQRKTDPAAMARALAEDARERGL
jgi:hypothetical protein